MSKYLEVAWTVLCKEIRSFLVCGCFEFLTNSQNTGDPSSRAISLFCDCFEHQHMLRKFITTSVYLLQSGEAAAGGEVEGDGRVLLTKDDPPRCSRWRQVCWQKDDCLNGGPSVLLRPVQPL